MTTHRRTLERQSIHAEAELLQLNQPDGVSRAATVSVEDISFGGAKLVSSKAYQVGSLWRLRLRAGDQQQHDLFFLIRSCRPATEGSFTLGGQHVIDPAILLAVGVSPDQITSELRGLIALGKPPHWEARFNIHAQAPLTVATLNATTLSTESDLISTGNIVDCTLDIAGNLHAPNASLTGGSTYVLGNAAIGELGSANGVPTLLALGSSFSKHALLGAVDCELKARRAAVSQKRQILADINAKPSGSLVHTDREMLTVLMMEIPELEQRLELMELNRKKLTRGSALLEGSKLHISRAIHPGATLGTGAGHLTFSRRLDGPVTLRPTSQGGFEISEAPAQQTLSIADYVSSKSQAA